MTFKMLSKLVFGVLFFWLSTKGPGIIIDIVTKDSLGVVLIAMSLLWISFAYFSLYLLISGIKDVVWYIKKE
jgi:hypothetical protein